jgi:protein TonB
MVVLEAVIDSRGVVTNVRVVKSIPLLDEAAVEAVKQWRYQATMLNGQAVPVVMTVTLNFGLEAA